MSKVTTIASDPFADGVLAWHQEWEVFVKIHVLSDGTILSSVDNIVLSDFSGWIPMPRFEPEQ